jgi:hypothetical protein
MKIINFVDENKFSIILAYISIDKGIKSYSHRKDSNDMSSMMSTVIF